MNANAVVRSVSAVLVGVLFVTVAVEALELTLVTAISRDVLSEPSAYYAVRNGTAFLVVKLLYTAAGAMGGGYLTGRLAGRGEFLHGGAAALIQMVSLVWLASRPRFAQWAPLWLWVALVVITPLGILAGAHLAARRRARVEERASAVTAA